MNKLLPIMAIVIAAGWMIPFTVDYLTFKPEISDAGPTTAQEETEWVPRSPSWIVGIGTTLGAGSVMGIAIFKSKDGRMPLYNDTMNVDAMEAGLKDSKEQGDDRPVINDIMDREDRGEGLDPVTKGKLKGQQVLEDEKD